MTGYITSFVLGFAAGTLSMAALAFPRIGRILVRSLAAMAMAAGAGMLTWSLFGLISGVTLHGIRLGLVAVTQPEEALAWSVGLLVAGITALVLSFLGGYAR